MCQYMRNVCPVFETWEKLEGNIPPGYQEIKWHLIFEMKMGDKFLRQARFDAGGHMTDTPATLTHAYVFSRDLVRISLNFADINVLGILVCDIQNAYFTAEFREKIWTHDGPEFGSEAGTIMIVGMALYGLKSSVVAFHAHLVDTLNEIRLLSTKAGLTYGNSLRLNPTAFSTKSTPCVMLMIYCVYHTSQALHLDKYNPYSNSKEIRWII